MLAQLIMRQYSNLLNRNIATLEGDLGAIAGANGFIYLDKTYTIQDSIYQIMGGSTTTTRPTAMSVPAVARARNIICGTIGSLPLTTFNRITGAYVDPHRVINQPDPRVAGFVVGEKHNQGPRLTYNASATSATTG